MKDKLPYPQVTQAQYDLWSQNPVTIALTQCIGWLAKDVQDHQKSGQCYACDNADLTLSRMAECKGQTDGLTAASDYRNALNTYNMIERGDNV